MTIRALVVAVVLAAAPAVANAHAMLDHASPAVGSTVSPAPKELVLTFTETLEPKFSAIEVRNASGASMTSGPARTSGAEMRVGLKPLPAGTYRVMWRVLSVDTHRTTGSFSFRVGP